MSARPETSTAGWILRSAALGLGVAVLLLWLAPQAGVRLRAWLGLDAAHTAMPGYAEAVAAATPAVVNIYADRLVTERRLRLLPDPMRRFSVIGLGPPELRRQRSLGSGVIVSASGYVLTNQHLVAGAEDILAVLADGRVTRAEVIGTDRATDLAVLRIEGEQFPALALDAAPPPRVGDVVLAIGNPFGLGQTVTQGIVSGLGRSQLQIAAETDFIQTDAAINRGNSGGALINAHGELVGINTAIFAQPTPEATGIGFAIPVATATWVLERIERDGEVVRGWLGAEFLDAPYHDAQGRFGVVIAAVDPHGPAERTGLQPDDVVIDFNRMPVSDPLSLRRRESELPPGSRVRLTVLRRGVPFEVEVELARRPAARSPG